MGFLGRLFGKKTAQEAVVPVFPGTPGTTRYVVVDTELTGLDPVRDDLVSIGALRMLGGRIELGETFHELICPEADLKAKSVVIHGITPSQLADMPPIEMVLPSFLRYCGGDVLVGHCLSIDMAFLNREAKRLFGSPIRNPIVDTLSLFGWLRSRNAGHALFSAPLKDLRLYDIAKTFDITVEGAHDALADAYTTAQLFQRFLPVLEENGIRKTEDLLRVGDPLMQGEYLFGPTGRPNF